MAFMKYIVVKNGYGHEVPFLFNESFRHKEVFEALRYAHLCKDEVVSAGIIGITELGTNSDFAVGCTGFSTTLFVGARSEDSELIKKSIDSME